MFLANYGDGFSDLELPCMIEAFRRSDAVASLLLVQPTASFDIVSVAPGGTVARISALTRIRHLDQRRLLRASQGDLPIHPSGRRTRAATLSAFD